jgi:polyhydroxyalkanoate synthesis regulator phasin
VEIETMSNPSLATLEQARDVALRWAEPGGLGPEQAQRELQALLDEWRPAEAKDQTEHLAQEALSALERAFKDWLQRGESCEELLHQLLWILDPARSGVDRPKHQNAPWPVGVGADDVERV